MKVITSTNRTTQKMEEEEGYLELILGSMFSGKTTQLVQYYRNYTYIGRKVAVINYLEDKRYHDSLLSTHDHLMIPCTLVKTLRQLWSNPGNPFHSEARDADVILINEGQFFPDLYDVVIEMVEQHRKIVYIAGLDGDYQRNTFGQILDLIPYCDKVVKLQSMCSLCKSGKKGIFSRRITQETSQIVIGSSNYIPVCRSCYSQPLECGGGSSSDPSPPNNK
jgi:thymidine kinase